jgi:hypothetical protein
MDMLHRYTHWYTRLTTFEGYMGVYLDIDDVRNFVQDKLEDVNLLF